VLSLCEDVIRLNTSTDVAPHYIIP